MHTHTNDEDSDTDTDTETLRVILRVRNIKKGVFLGQSIYSAKDNSRGDGRSIGTKAEHSSVKKELARATVARTSFTPFETSLRSMLQLNPPFPHELPV